MSIGSAAEAISDTRGSLEANLADGRRLPRLLYLGDLPIEGAMAGAAVLYRLLSDYPPDRLRIALSNLAVGPGYLGAPRLPGIVHDCFFLAPRRPLYTRAGPLYRWLVLAHSPLVVSRFRAIAREFKPDAVLTVSVGYSWRVAALLARAMDLPLYIVSHDDWQVNLDVPALVRPSAERWFAQAYRQAGARFVVSPYMATVYERRYGAPAVVLYPSRVKSAPRFERPPDRVRSKPTNIVYAGSVYPRYAELLAKLAHVLSEFGCTLTIYSPMSLEEIHTNGLQLPNVVTRPVIPTDQMIVKLREVADILVVPMSFHADDRTNIEVAFPSKLADYTATGIPILVWGPPYCSAVRWASNSGGAAAVVQGFSDAAVRSVMDRLLNDSAYRLSLGQAALEAGQRMFAYEAVADAFFAAIA